MELKLTSPEYLDLDKVPILKKTKTIKKVVCQCGALNEFSIAGGAFEYLILQCPNCKKAIKLTHKEVVT